jgi:16S rRNA C967 or C1407 C5-methylase (RsmB/RsmF family)
LLKPGGVLTYSVCTFGQFEGSAVIERALAADPVGLTRLERPSGPWVERDGMAVLLPGESDGMMLAQLQATGT